MSIQNVNRELTQSAYAWSALERSAARNSASDREELMQLQDDLTALRNQLNLLDSEIVNQIKELSK